MSPIPRAQAIDAAWRGLGAGVEALSAPDGGPLSRAVKLVVIPLVLRPAENPDLAGPLLDHAGAVRLTALLAAHADHLRACAAWYTQLKAARRRLRLTLGSPQDLYFQRGFELAVRFGDPSAMADAEVARVAGAVVSELNAELASHSPAAVHDVLAAQDRRAALTAVLHRAWSETPDPTVPAGVANLTQIVLDACPGPATSAAEDALKELVRLDAGRATGAALRVGGPWPTWVPNGGGAQALGLTDDPIPQCPPLDGPPRRRSDPPFDRTVAGRVIGVLQHSRDRDSLPPVDEMLTDEAERTAQPWAVYDETLRVTAVLGTTIAAGLQAPGGPPAPVTVRAQAAINARWRREASLAKARRLTVDPDPNAHPRLLAVARRLTEPGKHYLRRLWVRLHGADTQGTTPAGLEDVWNVLDGVARSVVLDHRSRVRAALTAVGLTDGGRAA